MRKLVFLLAPAFILAGCASSAAPDEFAVARNAPLVIPPDYSLTPPVAGAEVTTPGEAQQQAIDALFGGPGPRSATESSILQKLGRESVELGIRSTAGDPATRVVDKGPATLAILQAPEFRTDSARTLVPQ